jgi:HAD superfamily hydrolase (TIGR01549 family)
MALDEVSRVKGWDEVRAMREYEQLYSELHSNTKTLTALGVEGEAFLLECWDRLEMAEYIKPDTKVVELIEVLAAHGLRQFVLSNTNRLDQIEKKLALIGVNAEGFEFLMTTVGMGKVKPDKEPFEAALKRMGDVEPHQVLYVGDRVKTDIAGARQVGMRTCLVWGESELADVSVPMVYDVGKLFEL